MSIISLMEAVHKHLTSEAVSGMAVLLIVLGTIIEIVPAIKINPWTWIVKKIGKVANEEVTKRLDGVEKDIKSLKEENKLQDEKRSEQEAVMARREILRFGDSLSHGASFSKDSYAQVLMDIDNYEAYCYSHPKFKNSMTKAATKKILSDFETRDANNDFLK